MKKHGFTLVELIIVIAVIGVLAAILIPTFSNVIHKANMKSAFSDARDTLSDCMIGVTDKQLSSTPDTLFIVHKGNEIFVSYYKEENSGLKESSLTYKYNEVPGNNLEEKADNIVAEMESAGYITPSTASADVLDEYQAIIEEHITEDLTIRADYDIDISMPTTIGGNNGSTDGGNSGEAGPSTGGTESASPETNPTASPAPDVDTSVFYIVYKEGNGGGVKDGTMPQKTEITAGSFGNVSEKIPMSKTVDISEDGAFAFTSWQGDDGKTYLPGDAVKLAGGETLTLTAQWDSDYIVIKQEDVLSSYGVGVPMDSMSYIWQHPDKKYILANDIVLSNSNSEFMYPIGFDADNFMYTAFTGVFDGAGHTISNLNCSFPGSSINSALFYCNNGTIRNFTLKVNGIYTKGMYVAGVSCINNGTIKNVDVTHFNRTGSAYSSSYGDIYAMNTQTSSSKASIIGGIAAKNTGTISHCSVTDLKLKTYCYYMGGIAGMNSGTIEMCKSDAVNMTVAYSYGGDATGGLVGYNTGNVSTCVCTGLIANTGSYTTPVGGLIGNHNSGKVSDCFVDWSNNTLNPGNAGFSGVIIGAVSGSSAKVDACVGIGRSGYTESAFQNYSYPTGYYTTDNITNCYLVGSDTRTVVNVITQSELQGRSPLPGLSAEIWDFSDGVSIPACN